MYWIKFHSKFAYMTAKATGQELCLTLTIQNAAKPALSETPAIQILQAGTNSQELFRNVIVPRKWTQQDRCSLLKQQQAFEPNSASSPVLLHMPPQEGIGLGGTKEPSTAQAQFAVPCSIPGLRMLRRRQRGRRCPSAPRQAMAPVQSRADHSPQAQDCRGTATSQMPHPQRWPVSPAKQG